MKSWVMMIRVWSLLVALTVLNSSLPRLILAHIETGRPASEEVPPVVDPSITSCPRCVLSEGTADTYWCPATQECFYYNGTEATIWGRDCTRPNEYDQLVNFRVPGINTWTRDVFLACMTEYDPYPAETNRTTVMSDCAFSFNETTGERITGEPSRIIIDDQHTKDNIPGGSYKYYSVPPLSMCRIMVANTLTTNFKSMFSWKEQTFAWFIMYKYPS